MNLYLLVEQKHKPIPDNIKVVQNFGPETVFVPKTGSSTPSEPIYGETVLVKGEEQAFIDWLKPFDGVWTTRSPMLGTWTVVHIKKELKC